MKNKKQIIRSSGLKHFKILFVLFCFMASNFNSFGQDSPEVLILQPAKVIHPFDEVTAFCSTDGFLTVTDADNKAYFNSKASKLVVFKAGGAAGTHKITVTDKKGKIIATATFSLEAPTSVNDGGKYAELFDILYKGMTGSGRRGLQHIDLVSLVFIGSPGCHAAERQAVRISEVMKVRHLFSEWRNADYPWFPTSGALQSDARQASRDPVPSARP